MSRSASRLAGCCLSRIPFLSSVALGCWLIGGSVFAPCSVVWAAQVTLAWDPNTEPELEGYRLFIGQASGNYSTIVNVGKNTTYTVSELTEGQAYYFAVKAYGLDGQESDCSAEVVYPGPSPENPGGEVNGDSDGDGFPNELESNHGSDPADPQSTPPLSEIPQTEWRIVYVDSEELVSEDGAAFNAIDGNVNTIWRTQWYPIGAPLPHDLHIDLSDSYYISGFLYLPRQDGSSEGRIKDYECYVSQDGRQWGQPVAKGSFVNDAAEKEVRFPTTLGRFIRLRGLSEVWGDPWTSVAEINVLAVW